MYACLKCGFIHKGIVKTQKYHFERRPSCGPFGLSREEEKGIEYYRQCPICKQVYIIKRKKED